MVPSEQIDECIRNLPDWQGEMLTKFRKIIHQAVPEIKEEWKWTTPVYSLNGMVCATGNFKDHVKINFFKGAQIGEPYNKLFNSGLDSKKNRGIDFFKGDKIDEVMLKGLILEAVKLN